MCSASQREPSTSFALASVVHLSACADDPASATPSNAPSPGTATSSSPERTDAPSPESNSNGSHAAPSPSSEQPVRPKSGRWRLCYYGSGALSNAHKLDLTLAEATLTMKLSAEVQDRGWAGARAHHLRSARKPFARVARASIHATVSPDEVIAMDVVGGGDLRIEALRPSCVLPRASWISCRRDVRSRRRHRSRVGRSRVHSSSRVVNLIGTALKSFLAAR